MKWRFVVTLALVLFVLSAVPVSAGGRPLEAFLTGAAEVPANDLKSTGTADITLNQGQGEVCFDIEVDFAEGEVFAPITAAHIHVGVGGVNGPVVVNFDVPNNGLSGCVDGVEKDLVKAIRQNPSGYYVNVHNAEFPAGALRGQLRK
jgi:hypothetical protein